MQRLVVVTVLVVGATTAEVSTGDYSDVLLVVNDDSAVSTQIAQAFVLDKPDLVHVCHVSTTDAETIDLDRFEQEIVNPIAAYLQGENPEGVNLETAINYIVTTKGLPLKLNYNGSITSIDSRIALIGTARDLCVIRYCKFSNPYYMAEAPFSVMDYPKYRIVGRLTGYTLQDALNLVQRSRRGGFSGTALLVGQPNYANDNPDDVYNAYQQMIPQAYNVLEEMDIPAELINDGNFPMGVADVSFYYSWGSNHWWIGSTSPPYSSDWDLGFNPGSIGYMLVSTSARTFQTAVYGQALLADLIADGLCGTFGHVAEPGIVGSPEPHLLAHYWLAGYTLGEAFMMSTSSYKMQNVLVGDPKMRIAPVISGHVRSDHGDPVAGVVLSFSGVGNAVTDDGGYYSMVVPHGWSGTLTPYKYGYLFQPAQRQFASVVPDQALQDFTCGTDCNNNGITDGSEIGAGVAGDCNDNGVPDVCDIANGDSVDDNENGIPDECEAFCGDAEHPYPIGDLDFDCYVWWFDFLEFSSHWGRTDCAEEHFCNGADLTADGAVDWRDFTVFASHWGECTDPSGHCGYER